MSEHFDYYAKQESPQKEICVKLHDLITSHLPHLKESMLWGVPVFNEGLFYIVALKDHVNLGFTISNLTTEEENMFQGGGKTTRKVEIKNIDEIDEEQVKKLLDFVLEKSNTK